MSTRTRIPELDGVRGLAILMVLLWHYVQNQLIVEVGSPLAYVKQALGFAWSGVDLFFVLSGFLITGILLDNQNKSNYFRVFYTRRICRIFPLYYLVLFIYFILTRLEFGEIPPLHHMLQQNDVPLWAYATYTQNIIMGLRNTAGPGFLAITWSLAIEEQFYLLLPFIVWIIPQRRLPVVFVWFLLMALYLRFVMPGLSAFINTPWRADSLMVGALLAYYIRIAGFTDYIGRHRAWLLLMLALVLFGIVTANQYGRLVLGGTLTHFSLAVLFGMLILYVVTFRDGVIGQIMRNRILVWLGSISYGVYLVHTGISGLMHGLIRHSRPYMAVWHDVAVTLLALVITLLLAHFSYILFEKRMISYGHKYRYK